MSSFIDMTTATVAKLIKQMIVHHKDTRIVICNSCRSVIHNDLSQHYQRYHQSLPLPDRQLLINHIQSLVLRKEVKDLFLQFTPDIELDEITGLSLIDSYKYNDCGYLGSKITVQKHCQGVHQETIARGCVPIVYRLIIEQNMSSQYLQ